ncbi:MAG TPA: TSUP family transporter [Gaiellaceae bacterium]|nr:TSUP family transporter [Gaiellaceae bacterium]
MGAVAVALLLGLIAGVVAGFFGVGGGILFVPTLALALGLSQLAAEATSLAAILPAAAAGALQQQRYGNVDWRTAGIIGVASIVGVEVGVRVADALPEHVLRTLFALLMFAVAGQLAIRAARS